MNNEKKQEYLLALEVAQDVILTNAVMGWTNPIIVKLRELQEELKNGK